MLGGFLIWYVWIQADPVGLRLMELATSPLSQESGLRSHLLDSAAHMRPVVMGLVLLLVLRFAPRGLIPEERRSAILGEWVRSDTGDAVLARAD